MRLPRPVPEGFAFHVMSRSLNGERIFGKRIYKDMFMSLLVKAKKLFSFEIHHFVIMDTHYHMIIEPLGDEKLKDIMHWILFQFAQFYNRKENRYGHVFAERYKSVIIWTLEQFFRVYNYITNNVKDLPGKVDPKKYIYSGICHIINKIYLVISCIQPKTWLCFKTYCEEYKT
ncbi:MAG: transposase [Spirochaetia bacterium]